MTVNIKNWPKDELVKFVEFDQSGGVFPESLSEDDKHTVMQQCINQHATSRNQVRGFAFAYYLAWEASHSDKWLEDQTPDRLFKFVMQLAFFIEPRNKKGIRTTPVHFANGASVPAYGKYVLYRLIEAISDALKGETRITSLIAFIEFEEQHPLEDGNGRLGHLLWAMLVKVETGTWPVELPPEFKEAKELIKNVY